MLLIVDIVVLWSGKNDDYYRIWGGIVFVRAPGQWMSVNHSIILGLARISIGG